MKKTNELSEIKDMFGKIVEIVSDLDIQELVVWENEDGAFLMEEEIIDETEKKFNISRHMIKMMGKD